METHRLFAFESKDGCARRTSWQICACKNHFSRNIAQVKYSGAKIGIRPDLPSSQSHLFDALQNLECRMMEFRATHINCRQIPASIVIQTYL